MDRLLQSNPLIRWSFVRAVDPDDFDALGRQFIAAYNRRDADALVALAHREIRFYPSTLVGARRRYDGHDGLRQWIADLAAAQMRPQVQIREIRPLGPDRFLLLSEVRLDGDPVTDAAMIASVEDGRIVEARSFLTDEQTLAKLGLISRDEPAL